MSCLGVVLAGGQSRRMGHDKMWIQFGGATLAEHVLRRLLRQLGDVVLNCPEDRGSGGFVPLVPFVCDMAPFVGLGPLSGLYAALHHAATKGSYDCVITVAVDTPFFPKDYVARLCEMVPFYPHHVLMATSDGHAHPTFALWPCGIRKKLEHFPKIVRQFPDKNCGENKKLEQFVELNDTKTALAEHLKLGDYSILSFAKKIGVHYVPFLPSGGGLPDSFFNINRPQDLQLARKYRTSLE